MDKTGLPLFPYPTLQGVRGGFLVDPPEIDAFFPPRCIPTRLAGAVSDLFGVHLGAIFVWQTIC